MLFVVLCVLSHNKKFMFLKNTPFRKNQYIWTLGVQNNVIMKRKNLHVLSLIQYNTNEYRFFLCSIYY